VASGRTNRLCPSRAFRAHGNKETARRRAKSALLGVGASLLQLPSRVAASWFTAPPARFRPPWGSPREATPHAFARGCAGRALGPPSGVSDPVVPLPARRPRDDSPGVSCLYGTFQRGGSGLSRGSLPPAPSALRVWLPSRRLPPLHAWRRPVDRRSAHEVRPSGSCSSPPAVPLSRPRLSCRSSSPPVGGWSRLQRLAPAGKGPGSPPPEGGDGRTLPSWDSAPPRLPPPRTFEPASRSYSLMAFCWGCSLRTTPSPDYRGFSVAEAAWSLMRLPAFLGFGTFSNGGPLRATRAPGLWLCLGPRTLASEGLLGAPDCPTGVRPRVVSVRRFVLTPDTNFLSEISAAASDCRTGRSKAMPLPVPRDKVVRTGYPQSLNRSRAPDHERTRALPSLLHKKNSGGPRGAWKTLTLRNARVPHTRAESLARYTELRWGSVSRSRVSSRSLASLSCVARR
jgi:hypothetical protein